MSLTLRDYQARAIHDLRCAYRQGARAPLFVMATGGGKTIVLAAITAGAVDRGRRVLILVHRRELIRQASAKLSLADVPHGVIAAGFPASDEPVQVASVQSLARRLERQHWQPDLIVIDEAHHAVAGTWASVLSHWPHAFRLGVTATPIRQDGRGLGAVFDHLVKGPSVASLTAQGHLSPARLFAPPMAADLSGLQIRAGDYKQEQIDDRLNRPTVTGDAITHYRRFCNQKRAIAFCCSANHAHSVADAFNQAEVHAVAMLGSTPTNERDEMVRQFAAGNIHLLVTVDVVSEGFDCPDAEAAILLRPTASLGLYLQQVGRVLRPAPGKDAAVILDHVGNVHRHGFPDDSHDWSLDDRLRRSRAGGPAAPSVRTCEQCFAAFAPAPQCPVCGAACAPAPARRLKQVDGELVEWTSDGVPPDGYKKGDIVQDMRFEQREYVVLSVLKDRLRVTNRGNNLDQAGGFGVPVSEVLFVSRPSAAARREQGKARSLPELLAIARHRGYSPAWAHRVHNARQQRA